MFPSQNVLSIPLLLAAMQALSGTTSAVSRPLESLLSKEQIESLRSSLPVASPDSSSSNMNNVGAATIDTTGEVSITNTNKTTSCEEPRHFLNGKLNSCDTFRIATLNANPARQCIHIEIPSTPVATKASDKKACTDYKDWHDGTNGCEAYGANPFWCIQYGDLAFDSTDWSPKQACCTCGGGNPTHPRLTVGDFVTLDIEDVKGGDSLPLNDCPRGSLQVVGTEVDPRFEYIVRLTQPCMGQPAGASIRVASDDPLVIDKYHKVELRECKVGAVEQEFVLTPTMDSTGKQESNGGDDETITIRHKVTGMDLSKLLEGVKIPFFDIGQVYDDWYGNVVYIKAMTSNDKNGKKSADDGKPSGLRHSYLASGLPGPAGKTSSEVLVHYAHAKKQFEEKDFSKWMFLPIDSDVVEDNLISTDVPLVKGKKDVANYAAATDEYWDQFVIDEEGRMVKSVEKEEPGEDNSAMNENSDRYPTPIPDEEIDQGSITQPVEMEESNNEDSAPTDRNNENLSWSVSMNDILRVSGYVLILLAVFYTGRITATSSSPASPEVVPKKKGKGTQKGKGGSKKLK